MFGVAWRLLQSSVLELANTAVTLDSQGNYEAAVEAYILAVQACLAASTRT